MKRCKKILKLILYPRVSIIVACDIIATFLLVFTFSSYGKNGVVAYVSYTLSAYALLISCLGVIPAIKSIKGTLMRTAKKNQHINRYMTDSVFKMLVSLHISVGMNIVYAVLKFISGVYYRSTWLITLATYYFLLLLMRFLLLNNMVRDKNNVVKGWKRCRICGICLIIMNIVFTGMVVLVLQHGEGFVYAGYLIYIMAAYDFYTITMAIINLIRSRKQGSPVFTAARVINMAAALITIMSLETAMITQFGSDDEDRFRHTMIAATGAGISVIMLIMAVAMIVHATKKLKALSSYTAVSKSNLSK